MDEQFGNHRRLASGKFEQPQTLQPKRLGMDCFVNVAVRRSYIETAGRPEGRYGGTAGAPMPPGAAPASLLVLDEEVSYPGDVVTPATDQTPGAPLISGRLHNLPQPGRHTTMPRRVALHPLPHRSPVLRLPASTRPGLRPLAEQLLSSRCRTLKHPRRHPIRTVLSINTQQPTHHRMRGISHRNLTSFGR
jgi:hypothetical protein